MDTVDTWSVLGFERQSRSHVREDHKLFDDLVGIKTRTNGNACHQAVLVDGDLAFRNIEIESATFFAGSVEDFPCGIKRFDDVCHQMRRCAVRCAVTGGLNLFIGQAGLGVHEAAHEFVAQ